jgi:eukaryotic-like serine/threonine-protein kinase
LRRARVMEPILARPLSPPARVVRWMRRRPAQAAVVGLFAVVAVLAMYLAARWPEIRRGRDERRREAVEEALAEGYLEVGKSSPEKAIEAFRKALALEPGTPEAVGGIALAHLRRGKPAEALDFLEKRRDLAAAYPELDWIRADALRGSGRESEAKEIDDGLGDPRTALGCFLLGSREIERGHSGDAAAFRRALELFEQAVIFSPDARAAYHFELAHAAGHVNDREAAVVVTKALQALWPDSMRGLFWTAYALSGVDAERAIRAYRELVRRLPNESSIRRNLGVALRQAGDPDGAIEALGEAIRLNAESESYNELGIAWMDKGNPEEALKAFQEAVRLKPEYAAAHFSVGLVLQDRGDDEGAIREFREAIRHSPRYGDAHTNLGVSLGKIGDVEGAIREFQDAIRLGPDSWNPHYGMGNVLQAKGEFEASLEAYREALRRNPDDPDIYCGMVICWRAMGDLDTALDRCREYLGKMPQSWKLQFQLGVVLQARGDLDAAIEALRKSLGQKADSPDVFLTLGVCLRTQGDLEGAERVYRRTIELRPAFAEAHCNLGLVLMEQGRFEEALESLRKGHQLGSVKPQWGYPSAEWVARCERSIELEGKLKRILSGEVRPEGAEERMELASVAHSKALYATAARLQKEAFAEEPELGADPKTFRRYNAACAAARAAAGEGEEGKLLDGPARALWRVQALHWLEADLAALRRLQEEGSLGKKALIERLGEWKADADLAGLREQDSLSALEEEERKRCRALWKAVEDLIAGTGGAPSSP